MDYLAAYARKDLDAIDGELELFVVDVVEFDDRGRISAIRAYLGRPSE